ncbi:MAG: YeeE/YedE family protein [Flavobacterium sp.]|nr:YeeE/YedE family protein [Flavobacterium sp.]MBP8157268.1 YeeE/YedE family protein [Flavobacterium sp.]
MNLLRYVIVGFIFGIILTKAEAVSWYRIYEMFQFQSFHMYGIIAVAIFTGLVGIQFIKRKQLKDIDGYPIYIQDKEKGNARYWIGGILFGLGWAMVGACPGPIFILLGSGFISVSLILFGAIFGTFLYGVFKDKLPH